MTAGCFGLSHLHYDRPQSFRVSQHLRTSSVCSCEMVMHQLEGFWEHSQVSWNRLYLQRCNFVLIFYFSFSWTQNCYKNLPGNVYAFVFEGFQNFCNYGQIYLLAKLQKLSFANISWHANLSVLPVCQQVHCGVVVRLVSV